MGCGEDGAAGPGESSGENKKIKKKGQGKKHQGTIKNRIHVENHRQRSIVLGVMSVVTF